MFFGKLNPKGEKKEKRRKEKLNPKGEKKKKRKENIIINW